MRITERLTGYHHAVLVKGRSLMPARVRRRLDHVHVFDGACAVAAGLLTATAVARFPAAVAFYVEPGECTHLYRDQRHPTIVLMRRPGVTARTVLHEYGHALDELLGWPSRTLPIPALTAYAAKGDAHERFAEAFMLWCIAGQRARVRRAAPSFTTWAAANL